MNSIFKMSMSHCCCMSHICCSFVRIKSYFVLRVCKSMTNFDKLYKKICENRYILHENVYIDKNKGKFDTNLSIVTPPR